MSVRQREYRDPVSGQLAKSWMVDVKFQHADGHVTRVRKVCPVNSKRGAEEYERQVRQELLTGNFGKPEVEVPTLSAFSKPYLSDYAKVNNKPSSYEAKRSIIDVHLLPQFGQLRLSEIGLREIESYKARKVTEGLSPKTVNNHLTVLRKVFAVAVEWGTPVQVPAFKWLKVPKQKFHFFGFEEAARLVQAADGEWKTMVLVALRTGLRLGELRSLRWEDTDLNAGRIVVRRSEWHGHIGAPKNGRTREVPLSNDARVALKAQQHSRGELVFCNPDGSMLTKEQCKRPLWRACKNAGLPRIGWHSCRHSFASHLVMRGAQMKTVQELMGHATMEMTMRYAHLSPNVRADAVNLLDTALLSVVGASSGSGAPEGHRTGT